MIYDKVDAAEEIRQGDIFRTIPRVEPGFSSFVRIEQGKLDLTTVDWLEIAKENGQTESMVVALRAVYGIVVTPDCDAIRSPTITFCEIDDFRKVEPKSKETKSAKSWVNIITQHARVNQKWFYLPPDALIGFDKKMAADFREVIRLDRDDVDRFRARLRIGRLKEVALEHFRNRVGEFFRRYPYDEWYPLDKAEAEAYKGEKPEPIKLFDWQK